MKKIFLTVLCMLAVSVQLFAADYWYVCLGSFENETNAISYAGKLNRNKIPVFISEHRKQDGHVMFRVIYEKLFTDAESAAEFRRKAAGYSIVKRSGINDVWHTSEPFEAWYICLGSFEKKLQAQNLVEIFKRRNLETFISEYRKAGGQEVHYRVLADRPFIRPGDAESVKRQWNDEFLYDMGIKNAWLCRTIKQENYVPLFPIQLIVNVEGRKVPDVDVNIDGIWNVHSDSRGIASLPLEIEPGTHSMTVYMKDGAIAEGTFTVPESKLPEIPENPENMDTPSEYTEGQKEKRIIIIKDSDTGSPVSNANVNIDEKWNTLTNESGAVFLPDEVKDGEHTMTVTRGDEYVPTKGMFTVVDSVIPEQPQFSIPKSVDYSRIKIILDWGEYPTDLDSHVICGSHHVYYSNMNEAGINLDRDDTSSYGPETITIQDVKPGVPYEYYVFNYSDRDSGVYGTRLSNSGAQVRVYFDNEYKATYKIQPEQNGITWHVFDIIDGNQIVIHDAVTDRQL